jgi:hypothetical protein
VIPVASRWNTRATIRGETIEHEAAHAVAAHLLGFEVGEISLDRWADFGHLGLVTFRWSDTIDDAEELAFARAIVAAAGPVCTDAWELERARRDRNKVAEVRWPVWTSDAWEFVVVHKTQRLIGSEPFRSLHLRLVAALEEVGEVGTLSGDELDRVFATPDAGLLSGAPRPSPAASARRSGRSDMAAKAADAVGRGTSNAPFRGSLDPSVSTVDAS